MKINKIEAKGFTLLELLIVIAILAILSVTLVLVLNPAESLRKSRDTQRMSDLSTMKSAIGMYLTTVNPPYLAGAASNDGCKTGVDAGIWAPNDLIYYSVDSGTAITDLTLDGSVVLTAEQVAAGVLGNTDGTGWLPVKLAAIAGGSPVSNMPIDPTNDITAGASTVAAVSNEALVYRYTCHADNSTFEINTVLESDEFSPKMSADGGNNTNYYEVGTKLDILGAGTDF